MDLFFQALVYSYIILLPIGTGLSGRWTGNISFMNYVILGIILTWLGLVIAGEPTKVKKTSIFTILYFFYTIISLGWSDSPKITWYITTNIFNGVLFFVLSSYVWNELKMKRINSCFYISQFIVYIVVLMNLETVFIYRLSVKVFSTIGIGDFAIGLCLLTAFWMSNAVNGKNTNLIVLSYVCVILNLFIILLAGSRGGMVMFFAMSVVWIFSDNSFKGLKLILLISVIAIYFVIVLVGLHYLPDVIQQRMTLQAIIDSRGSGRFNVWMLAYDRFITSDILRALFGHGFNSFAPEIAYGKHGGRLDLMAHNVIIQTLIEGGILGLLLLITMGMSQLKTAWKRKDAFLVICLTGLFVAGLSNDVQVTRMWGFILSYNFMKSNYIQENRPQASLSEP